MGFLAKIIAALKGDTGSARASEIEALATIDVSSTTVQSIAESLADPCARVRHAAATFFLHQARRGRREYSALPELLSAITRDYPESETLADFKEDLKEMSADATFRTVVSQAIAAIVGADAIHISPDDPDPDGFLSFCRETAESSPNMIDREDAKKYLKYLSH